MSRTVIMSQWIRDYSIRLGTPYMEPQPPAVLRVAPDRLTIMDSRSPPIILTPDEVISIDVEGLIPFLTQNIRVNHVAFDKTGDVVFIPVLKSCRSLCQEIREIGFAPKAKAAQPVEPGQSGDN